MKGESARLIEGMKVNRQEILLETGTNEVEIIEFHLGHESYGINVAKVREIVSYNSAQLTPLPDSHPSLMGMILVRQQTLPLINLHTHLGRKTVTKSKRQVVLVCEFNDLTNCFLVDNVTQIHRISWNDFKPMSRYLQKDGQHVTGSVTLGGEEMMILDLEQIIADIYPDMVMSYSYDDEGKEESGSSVAARHHRRKDVRLILAEDSSLIRQSIVTLLSNVGFEDVASYETGLAAFDEITRRKQMAEQHKKPFTDYLSLLITDIEMPQMDGLTLCRKVKEDLDLDDLKIIIFSSLINEQMAIKCKDVGADAYTTKPNAKSLISLIDTLCL